MNTEEIVKIIEKLRYQVSIIGQTIDFKKNPIESLILEMDWDREDIDKAHDIFERWDQKIRSGLPMHNIEFENDFRQIFGISYQELKLIILAFYENNQWTNVCEAYVDSFDGKPSVEYHSIMRRER